MQERPSKRMKRNSENLEDAIRRQIFKLDMIRRLVRLAESSDKRQEWSQIKKTYFCNRTSSARKINEDWHNDECISTGQGRMKEE